MSKLSPDRIPPNSPGIGVLILSLIFRLLVLGIASSFSWVLGMAIAFQYPSTSQKVPIAEKLLNNFKSRVSEKQLPLVSTTPPAPILETIKPRVQLTEAEKIELETELKQLQAQLKTLIVRTTAIENKLNITRGDIDLETRLNIIAQELAAPPSASKNKQRNQYSSPVLTKADMVTLPSDILFESGSNKIRFDGRVIVDNLIRELRNYQDVIISVSGYTDNRGKAKVNLEKSFLQAEVIAEYLSKKLGQGYRLLAIGYGESRPIAENDSQTNRQRNRRIEVKVHLRKR
ncbi:MAG: OmpA family protein [Trichodesmium sp. St16_bin4-tuft]|nr:OmpA family protein [Trichodesmium sp. ALOHA_ZT_67]MCL2926894.1 OmpA family protein [Trichodesmium sp. MAG_R01]MDE5070745.1 OmpA family protein [Trichodesmium sp. St5_bin8]MDE5095655.1 OmpA family protein [Trichodesmium sp. St11_bin5]MDE5101391.1 OmpA family protein [Trichodesmium sp. St16_bin4-tuft]